MKTVTIIAAFLLFVLMAYEAVERALSGWLTGNTHTFKDWRRRTRDQRLGWGS